jgi:hypothetical protein
MSALALGHPISTLCDGVVGFVKGERTIIPLRAMRIAIEIKQGLAVITTTRSFRNDEPVPIEAVLSFPVPFDSVMTGLRAIIDGRTLVAKAEPKTQARKSYEEALDRGKTAVLHEEALPGVHVLSVGQLGPDQSVEVVAELAMPLSMVDGVPFLRIPTTVGQLYGASPLLPSDDLAVAGNALRNAELSICADSGSPRLLAGRAVDKEATTIPLDRAIEISVPGAHFGAREGYDAKGRVVRLSLTPAAAGEGKFEAAVLFDRSGSTGALISEDEGFPEDHTVGATVWDAMRSGLVKALAELRPADRVALWQFDDTCQLLGESSGSDAAALALKLEEPTGGTELGAAIETVIAAGSRDVLVLTDGQTWASEVHSAAARGYRISAVLVGPASLDATIGHLASITGGQIFAALRYDVGSAVRSAIASMRCPAAPLAGTVSNGEPTSLSAMRAGICVELAWDAASTDHPADAVGRYASSLALPLLDEPQATSLAVQHGLCSHLTSLVLVDEEGRALDGLPEMRKVPLAATYLAHEIVRECSASAFGDLNDAMGFVEAYAADAGESYQADVSGWHETDRPTRFYRQAGPDWRPASEIDWDRLANALLAEDLSGLTEPQREAVLRLAGSKPIVDLAAAIQVNPVQIAIALLAETTQNRMAQRLARRVLGKAPSSLLASARAEMMLTSFASN